MKINYKCIFTYILILLGTIFFNFSLVCATSWIKLEPIEVDKRAEIVVYGTYDLDNRLSTSKKSTGVFTKANFLVTKYYRGNGPSEITAGIDMYDIGWVKEFQEEGGCFLLFLERDKNDKDFLTPIAGPNGMVQVINEKVKASNIQEEKYYNNILQNQNTIKPIPVEKNNKLYIIIAAIIGIVIVIISIYIIKRKYKT